MLRSSLGSDRNKTSRADRSHRRLGAPPAVSSAWQNPALHTRLGIQLGGGVYDSLTVPDINGYETTLETNGIPFTTDMVTGGHEWYTWRQTLYSFLTTVAFKHPGGTQ